jgi:hypothetical protein
MKARSFAMRRLAVDETAVRSVIEAVRSQPNGEIVELDRTIAAYERKHGMPSSEALEAVARGELRPTREIEGWMMAVRVREHLVKARSR